MITLATIASVVGCVALLVSSSPQEAGSMLTIEEAIDRALADSPDIIRAKNDVLLADVERIRALATVLPSLGVSATASEVFLESFITESRPLVAKAGDAGSGGSPVPSVYGPFADQQASISQPSIVFGLSMRQLVYDGGKWWALIERATGVRTARESALAVIRANLRLLVVRRFYDLAKASRGVETFRIQVRLAEEQLVRATERLKKGEGMENDVAAAERNLSADRVALARRVFFESTRARLLNLAIGSEPDVPRKIVVPESVSTATAALSPIVLPPTEDLVEAAFESRPEIKQSRAALEILAGNIAVRKGDHWPVIALGSTYVRTSRRPDRVLNDPTENFVATVGVDLRWNLFSGGSISASVEEGELELAKGRAAHVDLLRSVRSEVLEKVEQMHLFREVFELNRDGARSAEEAWWLAQESYRLGKASLVELRDAEVRYLQARDAKFEARFDIEIAREELGRAVGGDVFAAALER